MYSRMSYGHTHTLTSSIDQPKVAKLSHHMVIEFGREGILFPEMELCVVVLYSICQRIGGMCNPYI